MNISVGIYRGKSYDVGRSHKQFSVCNNLSLGQRRDLKTSAIDFFRRYKSIDLQHDVSRSRCDLDLRSYNNKILSSTPKSFDEFNDIRNKV